MLGILGAYIKARAEGVGLSPEIVFGVVERTERLILVLVGTGFTGLGIPYAVDVALWLLLVGSAVTVGQRILAVRREAAGRPNPRCRSRGAGVPAGPGAAPPPRRPAARRPLSGPAALRSTALSHRRRFAAGWGAVRCCPNRSPGEPSTGGGLGRRPDGRAVGSCGPTCGSPPAEG